MRDEGGGRREEGGETRDEGRGRREEGGGMNMIAAGGSPRFGCG